MRERRTGPRARTIIALPYGLVARQPQRTAAAIPDGLHADRPKRSVAPVPERLDADRPKRSVAPVPERLDAGRPKRGGMALILVVASVSLLAACGKKGPPEPVGPPDQVTFPRIYPTR